MSNTSERRPPSAAISVGRLEGFIDFESDIRQQILAELPHKPSATAELARKSLSDLVVIYRNWQRRLIQPRPRRVHCSKALVRNPLALDPAWKPALQQIKKKLKAGADISPHLSRAIRIGYESEPAASRGRSRRRDLDLLLNDWGIHHLHLSTAIEPNSFVKRSGPLLLAVLRRDDAYLIDIVPDHSSWTRAEVVGVMAREWPRAGLVAELHTADLSRTYSDADRKLLREGHINTPVEVDGRFFMPPGLMLSGVSLEAVMAVDRLLDHIDAFQAFLNANPGYLERAMTEQGISAPTHLDLHFAFFENGG